MMKLKLILATASLLINLSPLSLQSQVANEGLANQIIAARQRNATLMKQRHS